MVLFPLSYPLKNRFHRYLSDFLSAWIILLSTEFWIVQAFSPGKCVVFRRYYLFLILCSWQNIDIVRPSADFYVVKIGASNMFKLHKDHTYFLDNLNSSIQASSPSDLTWLQSPDFSKALFKVRSFNLDPAVDRFEELYSSCGRPCKDISVLLRSFLLMVHFRYTSVQKWHDDMKADVLLIQCHLVNISRFLTSRISNQPFSGSRRTVLFYSVKFCS